MTPKNPEPASYERVIEPRGNLLEIKELWRYRELFGFLAWRDILVRYKQTVIGIAWAVVRPLLAMIIFTVVFHKVAKLPVPAGVPYPLMVFAAMMPWQFFATSLTESSNSLIHNSSLISKIYFPRLVIPASSVITSFVDFLIALCLMAILMVIFHFTPDWRVMCLPLFAALAFGTALGAGLWLCSLNVKYRDFRYIIPFIVQIGFFISPVGYSGTNVPEKWQLLYSLNPMVGVIEGFRWSLLRGEFVLSGTAVAFSAGIAVTLLVTGVWHFRRVERSFADVI